MKQISISSDALKAGSSLPVKHTCNGEDCYPALSWEGLPDAPGQTFIHWVIYNISADSSGLPAAVPKNKTLDDGSPQGKNDFGRTGCNGPCRR